MTAPRLLGRVGAEEGSRSPRPAAVADLALPARALAFSPIRAGAPVDDHLDVGIVLVVLGQLVEQLVGELGWDDAIDHRAPRRILGTSSASARGARSAGRSCRQAGSSRSRPGRRRPGHRARGRAPRASPAAPTPARRGTGTT